MNAQQDPCMCPVNAKICRMMKYCPWLYDPKHPNYAKKLIVDESWNKIAEECNESVASCKERWGNIRAAITSGQLKINRATSGPNRVKPYYIENDRPFIITPMRDVRGTAHRVPEDINYDWKDAAPMPPIMPCIGVMGGGGYAQGPNIQIAPGMMPQAENDVGADLIFQDSEEEEEEVSEVTELDHEVLDWIGMDCMMDSSNTSHQSTTPTVEDTLNGDKHFNVTGHGLLGKDAERQADAKFLEALLPDMRAMNTRQKIVFKRKIYQSLEEVFENNANFPTVSNSAPNIASVAPAAPAAAARGDGNMIDPPQPVTVKAELLDDGGE